MKGFTYRDNAVTIPPTADIPIDLMPNGEHAGVIQQLLDGFKWRANGRVSIETFEVDLRFVTTTAANNSLLPFWAIRKDHQTEPPQLSPFINKRNWPLVSSVTLELAGTPDRAVLVRAYPGDYVPPLPWQDSAQYAPDGRKGCLEFWRSHSHLYSDGLFLPGSYTNIPPRWFTTL